MGIVMGIHIIWERLGWILTGWVLGWLVAKIWSHRQGWSQELDSDRPWIRLCCIVASLVPVLHWGVLITVPILILAHKDAERRAVKEHKRNLERMAHNQWWGETQFRWERKWERVPRRTH
jgi:hypothetical protein